MRTLGRLTRIVPTKPGKLHGIPVAPAPRMFHDTAGHEALTETIIACAIRVHESFGPGLLESIYDEAMAVDLRLAGLRVETTRRVQLKYREQILSSYFCPDLVVEEIVIVEIKAIERLVAIHTMQLQTYLKLTGLPLGLLMNFNVPRLKDGVRRVVRPDLYVRRSNPVGAT